MDIEQALAGAKIITTADGYATRAAPCLKQINHSGRFTREDMVQLLETGIPAEQWLREIGRNTTELDPITYDDAIYIFDRLAAIATSHDDYRKASKKTEKFFVYCPESGFEKFETIEARDKYAANAIAAFLEDGWDEAVEQVVAGEITHVATQTNRVDKPSVLDEDGCDPDGEYWNPEFDYTCDYELKPLAAKSN